MAVECRLILWVFSRTVPGLQVLFRQKDKHSINIAHLRLLLNHLLFYLLEYISRKAFILFFSLVLFSNSWLREERYPLKTFILHIHLFSSSNVSALYSFQSLRLLDTKQSFNYPTYSTLDNLQLSRYVVSAAIMNYTGHWLYSAHGWASSYSEHMTTWGCFFSLSWKVHPSSSCSFFQYTHSLRPSCLISLSKKSIVSGHILFKLGNY